MRDLMLPRAFRHRERSWCPDDVNEVANVGDVVDVAEVVERRLRAAAEQHAGWLRYVPPVAAYAFALADMVLTGDIDDIGNHYWLAVHLAVMAGSFTRGMYEARRS